ncbi:uncharacterized protein LOC141852347 [Brevipalpus obovatus]|uniref:uncharacterized protein LOC141852347 n=1 Tax=Brevipalpus obovatus TaxID=246614 RepID=UPI003D9E06E5
MTFFDQCLPLAVLLVILVSQSKVQGGKMQDDDTIIIDDSNKSGCSCGGGTVVIDTGKMKKKSGGPIVVSRSDIDEKCCSRSDSKPLPPSPVPRFYPFPVMVPSPIFLMRPPFHPPPPPLPPPIHRYLPKPQINYHIYQPPMAFSNYQPQQLPTLPHLPPNNFYHAAHHSLTPNPEPDQSPLPVYEADFGGENQVDQPSNSLLPPWSKSTDDSTFSDEFFNAPMWPNMMDSNTRSSSWSDADETNFEKSMLSDFSELLSDQPELVNDNENDK